MKWFVILLINLNFGQFYKQSAYVQNYKLLLEKSPSELPSMLSLVPFSPSLSYQAYKLPDRKWIAYYQLTLPVFSFQTLYFPFILNTHLEFQRYRKRLNHFRIMSEAFREYLSLWYYHRLYNITDSLLKIETEFLKYLQVSGEGKLEVLNRKKELLELKQERERYFKAYLSVLKEHGFSSNSVPEESPFEILQTGEMIEESLKIYKERVAEFRIFYEKRQAIYTFLGFLPRISFIYLHQFINLSPVNPLGSRKIKAFSLTLSFSPIEVIQEYRARKRAVEYARIKKKINMMKRIERKGERGFLNEKMELLKEIRRFCNEQRRLWIGGEVEWEGVYRCQKLYLLSLKEFLSSVYKRSMDYEK